MRPCDDRGSYLVGQGPLLVVVSAVISCFLGHLGRCRRWPGRLLMPFPEILTPGGPRRLESYGKPSETFQKLSFWILEGPGAKRGMRTTTTTTTAAASSSSSLSSSSSASASSPSPSSLFLSRLHDRGSTLVFSVFLFPSWTYELIWGVTATPALAPGRGCCFIPILGG